MVLPAKCESKERSIQVGCYGSIRSAIYNDAKLCTALWDRRKIAILLKILLEADVGRTGQNMSCRALNELQSSEGLFRAS